VTHVIALHGAQGAGKDTVANILVERYGFTRIGFADRLREICLAANPIVTYQIDHRLIAEWGNYQGLNFEEAKLHAPTFKPVRLREVVGRYGWDEAKRRYPEARKVQQVMGTEVFRDMVRADFWVDWVDDQISAHSGDYVIPDLRFPNEYRWLRQVGAELSTVGLGWAAAWVVERPNNPHEQTAANHASEAWHPAENDEVVKIVNDGTLEDLEVTVSNVLASALGLGHEEVQA
jgi:hypothetical protein